MSTHAQTYTSLLDQVHKKYLPHSNLLQLKNYRNKVACYKQNSQQPDLYYDCFQKIQIKISQDSQAFTNNFRFIEDQYKTCEKNCIVSYSQENARKECSEKCGSVFTKSTLQLYENFYKNQLSSEAEFKKIKK